MDLEIPKKGRTKRTKAKKVKAETSTLKIKLVEGQKAETIFNMFDNVPFKIKPKSGEIGGIKKRIENLQVLPYSLEMLKSKIKQGFTSIPSGIKTNKEWEEKDAFIQIFMLDIDNAIKINNKKENILYEDPRHITVEKVIEYCKEIELEPTFIYHTLSHTEKQHKLRLVYVLEHEVRDVEIVEGIYQYLLDTFKDFNLDESTTDLSRMFLGGKQIAYSSDKFYKPIIQKEETKSVEIAEVLDSEDFEFKKYQKALEGTSYFIDDNILWKAGAKSNSPISNFLVIVDEQINHNNGRDTFISYKVHGILIKNYKYLPQIKIDKQALENFTFTLNPSWKLDAIISAGPSNKDRMREVTQLISKKDVINKNIYAHTGFIKINDKLVFLYHGGFIGNIEDTIEVDLTEDKLQQYCFAEKEFEIQESLQTSFSILDLADVSITIPLLATTYLAPLTSIFKEEGINADYILWLEGKTGTRKSSVTAMILSHFGDFSRNSFPSSFRDTLNSIEKKSFIAKDVINVIDDYNPENLGHRKLDIAEKLFGMYGDRAGRDRMSQDGKTLKSPYIARGQCIVTGESFPNVAQSRLARAIIVDIEKDSINLSKLSELQENKEKLAFCMKKYIEWIIENETDIRVYAKDTMKKLQQETENNTIHGRTNEAVNVMTIGFSMFLNFLQFHDVIETEQKEELQKIGHSTLLKVAQKQEQDINDSNPVNMFVSAIEQLYTTNRIYLKDFNECTKTEYDNTVLVGYVDNKAGEEGLYYFFPDILYNQIIKFYKEQDIKFPISKPALWKYLDVEGYLYKTPKMARRTVRRQVPNTDNDIPFIAILQEKMKNIYLKPRMDTIN